MLIVYGLSIENMRDEGKSKKVQNYQVAATERTHVFVAMQV